jgi:hypothetical protein
MTPHELVAKLSRMFPQGFGGKGALADWGGVYIGSMEPFSGPILQQAFDQIMANWDRPFPPMPGALQVACISVRKDVTTGAEGKANMKRVGEDVAKLKPVLVDDWLRGHGETVETFLARFSDENAAPPLPRDVSEWDGKIHAPSDRQYAHTKLVNLVRNRAYAAAMRQAMGLQGQVDIEAADLDRIERQVQSQRHSASGHRQSSVFAKLVSRPLRDGPEPEPAPEMTVEDWERIEAGEEPAPWDAEP